MASAHSVEVRFFGSTKDFEAALAKMGIATDVAANDIGKKMEAGAGRTGSAFEKMGQKLEDWGVPFGSSLSKVGSNLQDVEGKGKQFGAAFSEIGKGLTLGVGAAALGVGVEAFRLGTKWQTAMASMATHAGIGIGAADKIGAAFLSTAGQSEFTATEMANAYAPVAGEFTNLTGHALNAKQALTVMSAASDLATASGESLTTTTKALADVMLPFHMNVNQSKDAANTLWNTQRLLGVSTSDLTNVYQRLTPFVAGSGMTFGQLSGMMVELTHSLGGGRQAARVAGRAIQSLIDPSSSANKALDQMGISLFNAQGKFVGMPKAIGELKSALATLPGASAGVAAEQKVLALTQQAATLKSMAQTAAVKAQEKAISAQLPALKLQAGALTQSSVMQKLFGANANAMLAIIAGGPAEFNKYTAAVQKHGQVESAAATQSKTWHVQTKILKSTLEDLGTSLGTKIVPIVEKVASDTAKVVGWFEKHKAVAKTLAVIIGGVLVSAMSAFAIESGVKAFNSVKKLGEGVGKLGTLLMEKIVGTSGAVTAAFDEEGAAAEEAGVASDTAFGPIGLIIGAVVIAGYELVTHWKTISRWISEAWHGILSVAKSVWHTLTSFFKSWWPVVLGIFTGGIGLLIGELIQHWATVRTDVITAWDDIVTFFKGIPGKFISALSSLGSLLLGWIGDAWGALTGWVETAVAAEIAWWTEFPGKIIAALGAAGSMLLGWGEQLLGGLWSGVTTAWAALGNIGSTIEGWVTSALSTAAAWLVTVGGQIIDGLANGITAGITRVVSAVTKTASKVVNAVKSFFGISSPSKVFHEIGTNLVAGLANGIMGSTPLATGALAKLTASMSSPITGSAILSVGSSMRPAGMLSPGAFSSSASAGAVLPTVVGGNTTSTATTLAGHNVTVSPVYHVTVAGLPEQIHGQVTTELERYTKDMTAQIEQALRP